MGDFSTLTDKDLTQSKNPEKSLSWTKTVESGAFIRTTYRKGNKRKTETKKMSKNDKKVVLGRIGDFEVYVYPFDYPDTVFIGTFPVSTKLDTFCINQLFTAYNRARWFLNGEWQNEPQSSKAAKIARQRIVSAYNQALHSQRRKE